MKALLGFIVVVCIAMIAGNVLAHGGGRDKFGGHTEKATGIYHCHTDDCAAFIEKATAPVQARIDELNAVIDRKQVEIDDLTARANGYLRRAMNAEDQIDDAARRADDAEIEANRAQRNAADVVAKASAARDAALRDMREAEARAVGAGPAVSSRCKDGVRTALNTGWRFSGDEKEALRAACLY